MAPPIILRPSKIYSPGAPTPDLPTAPAHSTRPGSLVQHATCHLRDNIPTRACDHAADSVSFCFLTALHLHRCTSAHPIPAIALPPMPASIIFVPYFPDY